MSFWKQRACSSANSPAMLAISSKSYLLFKESKKHIKNKRQLSDVFTALKTEIKKLDYVTQIHLFATSSEFLNHAAGTTADIINSIDLFAVRSYAVLHQNKTLSRFVLLVAGVLLLAMAAATVAMSLGMGVGLMMGVWQTPMLFVEALLAAETAAVTLGVASVMAGLAAGGIASYMFFGLSRAEAALDQCIDVLDGYCNIFDIKKIEPNQQQEPEDIDHDGAMYIPAL